MDGYELTLENFLPYTEVDVGADRIQFTANRINHLARCDEDTYLYRDLGAEIVGDFEAFLDVKTDFKDNESRGVIFGLTNALDDFFGLQNSPYPKRAIGCGFLRLDPDKRIEIIEQAGPQDGTGEFTTYWPNAVANTIYYLWLKRVANDLFCHIYDDAQSRNNKKYDTHLLAVLKLALIGQCLGEPCKFRYLHGCNTWNYGTTEEQNNIISNLKMVMWSDPTKAYDGDISTYSEVWAPPEGWSPFLILTRQNATKANTIKLYASGYCLKVDIDLYHPVHGWIGLYEGDVAQLQYVEKTFTQTCCEKLRIRAYNHHAGLVKNFRLHHLDFEPLTTTTITPLTRIEGRGFPYAFPMKFAPYTVGQFMDPALAGECRAGCFRAGVLNPVFDKIIAALKQHGHDTTVTWMKRVEGDKSAETGLPLITWTEQDIDCFFSTPGGGVTRLTAIGLADLSQYNGYTMEPLKNLDRVKMPYHGHRDRRDTPEKRVYEVLNVQDVFEGVGFLYRSFTLKHLDQL